MKNTYETSASEVWVDSELLEPEEVTVLTVETQHAETWSELSVTSDEQHQPVGPCDPISEYYTASSEVSLLSDMEFPDRCQNEPLETSLLLNTEQPDRYQESGEMSLLPDSELFNECQNKPVQTRLLSDIELLDNCQKQLVETPLLSDTGLPDMWQKKAVETSLLSDMKLPDRCQNEPVETLLSDIKLPDRCHNELAERSLLSYIELPDKYQNEPVEAEGKGCVMAGHVAAMRVRFESMTRANTPCPDLVRSISPTLDVFRITPSPDSLG